MPKNQASLFINSEETSWDVLGDIASRDAMTVPQLCTRLHDELEAERQGIENFASFLRVCCGRCLALQLSGGIPRDASIPIGSLNARRVLATEQRPFSSRQAPDCEAQQTLAA